MTHDRRDLASAGALAPANAGPQPEHGSGSSVHDDAAAALLRRMVASPADTAESARAVATGLYAALSSGGDSSPYYGDDVHFHDPLFGDLVGRTKVLEMWKLCQLGSSDVHIVPHVGEPALVGGAWQVRVHWDANYRFGPMRHPVVNHADTILQIHDGKVVRQVDSWDLAKWTHQAMPEINGNTAVATASLRSSLDVVHEAGAIARGVGDLVRGQLPPSHRR